MYRCKTKCRTSYHDRYNALTPSDCQVMQSIQALLALSIHRQCQSQKNSTYNDGYELSFKANVFPCILRHSTKLYSKIKTDEDLSFHGSFIHDDISTSGSPQRNLNGNQLHI